MNEPLKNKTKQKTEKQKTKKNETLIYSQYIVLMAEHRIF